MNKLKCYIGIDIGSISTKGVIINEQNEIMDSIYIETEANPIKASKKVAEYLKEKAQNYQIKGIGTTGSARKLIGLMLDANIIKNEITAHAIGTMNLYPEVSTILEIGGQDSKIILMENGMIKDYAMNTLCAAGTGAFLSSQAKRLHIPIEEFGTYALKSTNPVNIAARCTVFAESDLIHKAQMGYPKEDIIAGLCKSIVLNYLNNVARGKKIKDKVVFQGGVSKNIGVQKYFKEVLQKDIIVDKNGHLMGAYGIAILSHHYETDKVYDFNLKELSFQTKGLECNGCSNHCEIVKIYKNDALVEALGSRCGRTFHD